MGREKVTVGPNATWRPAAAGVLLLSVVLWTADLSVLRAGTPDPLDDTWEYGVAARHLLAGDGFRTSVIHPPLWSLRDSAGTVPLLVHGPLLPTLLAPILRVLGPRALDGIAWLAALFVTAAALLVFNVGSRYFGTAVGGCAAVLFTLAPATLRAVHHDISPALAALMVAAALDLLARPRPRALLAGLVCGSGYLVRPELLLLAVLFAPLAGRRGVVILIAGALLVAAPWMVHNARATGLPTFNLSSYLLIGYWGTRPELSVLRDFRLTPARWPAELAAALPSLPAKWLAFAPHMVKRVLCSPSGTTGWLAPLGWWSALTTEISRRLAVAILLAACVPIAVLTTMVYAPRYMVAYLPLWSLAASLGARAVAALLPAWARRPQAWVATTLALSLPPFARAAHEAVAQSRALELRIAQERAVMARQAGAPDIMFSDTPDFVAWMTGHPVVWVTRSEYDQLPAVAPPDGSLPSRAGHDTWFHDPDGRVRRGPAEHHGEESEGDHVAGEK